MASRAEPAFSKIMRAHCICAMHVSTFCLGDVPWWMGQARCKALQLPGLRCGRAPTCRRFTGILRLGKQRKRCLLRSAIRLLVGCHIVVGFSLTFASSAHLLPEAQVRVHQACTGYARSAPETSSPVFRAQQQKSCVICRGVHGLRTERSRVHSPACPCNRQNCRAASAVTPICHSLAECPRFVHSTGLSVASRGTTAEHYLPSGCSTPPCYLYSASKHSNPYPE